MTEVETIKTVKPESDNSSGRCLRTQVLSQRPLIRAYNGDCMDWMQATGDHAYDLAIVDPPYGKKSSLKKQYHKNAFTVYRSKKWDEEPPQPEYFDDLRRVSDNQIIWGANYFTKNLPPAKNWIVWDKMQPDSVSFSMYELAFYSGDGQAKIYRHYNGANRCTIKEKAQKYIRIHQTQKPVALYRWLLQNYAKAGQRILDTHGGSFSSAVACFVEGYDLDICEIDAEYFKAGVKRFKQATKQYDLFSGRL